MSKSAPAADLFDPPARPFRLIVTYRSGVSLCVCISLTSSQQRLLQRLLASVDVAVPAESLIDFAYERRDPSAPATLSSDIGQLDKELTRLLIVGAIRRGPRGGYLLATDEALISIPENEASIEGAH